MHTYCTYELSFIYRGMLGHFAGERPWFSIEDLVSNQSGVLVGKDNNYCLHF